MPHEPTHRTVPESQISTHPLPGWAAASPPEQVQTFDEGRPGARGAGTPPLTTKFREQNPVKFLTNQILHLGEVTRLVEDRVLGARDEPQAGVVKVQA